jgi:hypothetical protein
MSVTRNYGKVVFICDECGEDFETGEADFEDALDTLRNDAEGSKWTSMHDEGTGITHNYCPHCSDNI